MKKGAVLLKGTKDFSTFRSSSCSAKSPIKTLNRVNITKKGNLIEYMGNGKAIGNRQNKKTYFFPNGAIYIIKTNKVYANKYYFKKTIPFEMNFKTSLDIDSKEDIKKFKFYKKL